MKSDSSQPDDAVDNTKILSRKNLPAYIKARLEAVDADQENLNLNQGSSDSGENECESGSKVSKEQDQLEPKPIYLKRARAIIEQNQPARSRSFHLNVRLFSILALIFALYYAYGEWSRDDTDLAIKGLKAKLPVTLDKTTVLEEIKDRGDELTLYINKEDPALGSTDPLVQSAAMTLYRGQARILCENDLFAQIIGKGKKVTVLLTAPDGSYSHKLTLESCAIRQESDKQAQP